MGETETKVQNYFVFGSLNQRKMHTVGNSFAKYLDEVGRKFTLSPDGRINNMDRYGYNARSHNNRFSLPGEDYVRSLNIQHNTNRVQNPAALDEAGFKFPHDIMTAPDNGKITLCGNEINLATLSPEARQSTIKAWQQENMWNYVDDTPPLGFCFGVLEPNYREKANKPGTWANGLNVHCDNTVMRPRAMIVSSKNLDLWLDWEFTDADLVVCNWQSGTTFGLIKIVCYYGENDQNLPRAEQKKLERVISKKLRRFLNKCRREEQHFILLSDTNSWSEAWNMPAISPDNVNWWRGEQWEDALLDYNISVLNQGNAWTFYSFASTPERPIRSIIDVNMCSAGLDSLVSNWSVRDCAPEGDHCSTEFLFHVGDSNIHETTEVVFDFSKLKVMEFIQYLEDKCPAYFDGLETGNLHTLNEEVNDFYKIINEALHLYCPTKIVDKRKMTDHSRAWWDKDCRKWRNKLTKIKSYIRHSQECPLPPNKRPKFTVEDRKEASKNYYKAIKKAQKRQWDKDMAAKISNRDLGKLQKALKPKANAEVNCFKNRDGTSMTPLETLETLCKEHFPRCRTPEEQEPIKRKRQEKIDEATFNISDNRANVITLEGTLCHHGMPYYMRY